jgi:hypothetical protein
MDESFPQLRMSRGDRTVGLGGNEVVGPGAMELSFEHGRSLETGGMDFTVISERSELSMSGISVLPRSR